MLEIKVFVVQNVYHIILYLPLYASCYYHKITSPGVGLSLPFVRYFQFLPLNKTSRLVSGEFAKKKQTPPDNAPTVSERIILLSIIITFAVKCI